MGVGEWESEAENWVTWARTPGHDAYWYFRDRFFEAIVPPPGRRTLEIGSGEGRVARDLAARGHRVTALDTARALVRSARREDPAGRYLVADGAALPFPDGCFDIAVAYNALQVVQDMPGTVREAARVLGSGGCLCLSVAHPVTDLGRFVDDEGEARFILRRPYFETVRVDDIVEQSGLTMRFQGWTYTLEDYASALEQAGFLVEALREPRPAESNGSYDRWRMVPLFLNVRAVKR